jgi:hypothetical protein
MYYTWMLHHPENFACD